MKGRAFLTIGRVTGIHGLKGYLKVQSFAESISVFKAGMKLNVRSPGEKTGVWHEILDASPYKKGLRILFKNVDINSAPDFIGKELLALREDFYDYKSGSDSESNSLESNSLEFNSFDSNSPESNSPDSMSYYNNVGVDSNCHADSHCHADSQSGLEKDTYFWEDLIGLSVIDLRDGYLGKIDSVMVTGSNDVFVVKGGKREVLVPGLKSVVLSVDIDKNEMKIDLPEGL